MTVKKKGLKIASWNVNGLRAVAKKGLLQWCKKYSPDILCLQEIKAHPGQLTPELRNIPGYHAHFHPAERPGYSGVATYTKMKPKDVTY